MAMSDGLQYTQSLLFGLVVSFLLAKLFSFVFSSEGDHPSPTVLTSSNPNQSHTPLKNHKRSDANHNTGAQNEPPLTDQYQGKIAAPAAAGDSDDDWEGVETTELDEAFGSATVFLAGDRSSEKVSSKLRLDLYGLYKIATEGACTAPQPSAIKFAARAKWNAWHKLGAMSPEEAMQKYIEIVTELYPNWANCSTSNRRGGDDNEKSCKDGPMGPDLNCSMHKEESGNECKVDATDDIAASEVDADNMPKCIKDDVDDDVNDVADRNYPCDLSHSD